jgi:hypothetical protein
VAALDEENEQLRAQLEEERAAREVEESGDEPFAAGVTRLVLKERWPILKDASKQKRRDELVDQIKTILIELKSLEEKDTDVAA